MRQPHSASVRPQRISSHHPMQCFRKPNCNVVPSLLVAQTAHYCPREASGVCYTVNVPEATASSGAGDLFFQISGPTSWSWIALGQGSQMANSNIFVIYTSASGNNVTLSPRTGKGHVMPKADSDARVTLLDGSGVQGGEMTANIRCTSHPSLHRMKRLLQGTTHGFEIDRLMIIYRRELQYLATQRKNGPRLQQHRLDLGRQIRPRTQHR